MEFKERLAKALYEGFFDDRWEDLTPGGIERAIWRGLAQKAIEMHEAEGVTRNLEPVVARGWGGAMYIKR